MTIRPAGIALAIYTVIVLAITMTPQKPGPGLIDKVVNTVLDALHGKGLLLWVDYSLVEFTANILMFVPLGVLVAIVLPRRLRWLLLVIGTVFSTLIELTQLLIPGRFSDVGDVIANSAGFLIGAGLTLLVKAIRRSRR